MKISKFRIQKYRAIEDIEINLSYSINPIIGVNESGKTSILKAILAFDKNRDRINVGEHLEYQNKYSTNPTRDCRISAYLNLDTNEIEALIKYLKLKTDSEDFLIVSKFTPDFEFILIRDLSNEKKYSYINTNLEEKTNEKITKFLVNHIPFILYFDDFTDRVPDQIEFPHEYVNNGKLKRGKLREWQEIIEEIFKRANIDGVESGVTALQSYMEIEDPDRKGDILSDIEDELNKEIINEWKNIKKRGSSSLADDSEKLNLVIVNEDNKFVFKVRDKSNQDRRRTFNIVERSKGFQWFFNYMIKLKFNPSYKKTLENSIFLLDEPGSYLHSSAQVELLNELKNVSEKNTIIYCTHSQYLLNPNVIQLGSIKIAEKEKSIVSLQEYGRYKGKKDKGALSPIYQALQLNFAHDFLGRVVISEGITDFYLFKMIQRHTTLIDEKLKFIPSSGAGQSGTLISLAISFADSFLILLDNDRGGLTAQTKYKKEFGEFIEKHIFVYQSDERNFTLEDYLSLPMQGKLKEITNSNDLKRAFGFLYYDYSELQEDFIKNLDAETLKKLNDCLERFRDLV